MKKMAKGEAGDAHGVVLEMLQHGGSKLWNAIAELFSDILDPNCIPPQQWRESRLIILFKKG